MDRENAKSPPRTEPGTRRGTDEGSELARTRSRLKDTEIRLHAVLETEVDGIITIDERGVIETVNAAVERLFGYPAAELVGSNVSVLMPDGVREDHDGYIRRYLETGETNIIGTGREVEGRRRDGSRIPLDLAVSEMQIDGRRLFTGILRDISARRRAEEEARRRLEELAHASRVTTLGELTTVIAHEVNQPLAAIVSFAEACVRMLRSADPDTHKLERALVQIVDQGQRAGEIIRHLRRMARKGVAVREPVALEGLLGDVLVLFGNELRALDIELVLDVADGLPPVRCNRVQIEQVVINLLRNAMQAVERSPAGERLIRLRMRARAGPAVELSVEDCGEGIASEDAERVFEAFFSTKPHGMGMGLSVCRSIVEDHGGRLWTTADEGGAVFHVLLPAEGAR